jgi:hypothetical protein
MSLAQNLDSVQKAKERIIGAVMDEGRKRVIGVMAAILTSLHMRTADDLFGGPQGSHGVTNSSLQAFNGLRR